MKRRPLRQERWPNLLEGSICFPTPQIDSKFYPSKPGTEEVTGCHRKVTVAGWYPRGMKHQDCKLWESNFRRKMPQVVPTGSLGTSLMTQVKVSVLSTYEVAYRDNPVLSSLCHLSEFYRRVSWRELCFPAFRREELDVETFSDFVSEHLPHICYPSKSFLWSHVLLGALVQLPISQGLHRLAHIYPWGSALDPSGSHLSPHTLFQHEYMDSYYAPLMSASCLLQPCS